MFGLGLVAIPVLIHIFKPRRVRRTPFSSLRWLRASQHRIRRRIKWHQLLLLLLRIAFITFIVLAVAKPVISFDKGVGKADRFIILDTGRNMAYRMDDEPRPIEVGKRIAEKLISHVIAGDRTTILLAGSEPRALGPLVGDAGVYLQQLRAAQVESGSADLTASLRLVLPMTVSGRGRSATELFFVTDNHVWDWRQGDIAHFMSKTESQVRVHVIQVGPDLGENAWVVDARLDESGVLKRRAIKIRLACVGHERHDRTVRVTGLAGLPPVVEDIQINPGHNTDVEFELPAEYDLSGKVARIQIEPADAVSSDDVYWLNLDSTWVLKVLVIEPESTQIEELQPGFHLRTALESLSAASGGGSPVVIRRSGRSILTEEINEADVIMMVDVPTLSEGNLRALEAKVQRGTGLVVFLGPSISPEFYNSKLHDPLRPASCLLPMLVGKKVSVHSGRGLARISGINWSHPLFQGLFDPIYGDLTQVQFTTYFRLEPSNRENDRVIASIEQTTPAIIERSVGAGKVIMFNMTANDNWSDLPRRKSFVPLVDRLLNYLTVGTQRGIFTVGETAVLSLPDDRVKGKIEIETPSGKKIKPLVNVFTGGTTVQVNNLDELGVYHVSYHGAGGNVSFPFVVNPGAYDGSLVRVDARTLQSWWSPAQIDITRPDPGSGFVDLEGTRLSLDPLMIVLACLAFLAEMFFVHWLCPKMNPGVTLDSVVSGRGFFSRETGQAAGVRMGMVDKA